MWISDTANDVGKQEDLWLKKSSTCMMMRQGIEEIYERTGQDDIEKTSLEIEG